MPRKTALRKTLSRLFSFLIGLALLGSTARGEWHEVKLKDGRILMGDIVEKEGILTVIGRGSLYQFKLEDVESKSPAPEKAPEKVSEKISEEISGLVSEEGPAGDSPAGDSPAGDSPAEESPAKAMDGGVSAEPPPPAVADATDSTHPATPETPETSASTEVAATGGETVIDDEANPIVTIHTNRGKLPIELFEDEAPNTVANFVSLAEKGFYEGTRFHRIIKGFMMQGGDPNTKSSNESTWGRGGPGYTFADEAGKNPKLKNKRGYLSMANAGPNTNGSQFFVLFKDSPWLDGKHTVFGKITDEGMKVVDDVEENVADPRRNAQKPLSPVKITDVTVDRKRSHPYVPEVNKK